MVGLVFPPISPNLSSTYKESWGRMRISRLSLNSLTEAFSEGAVSRGKRHQGSTRWVPDMAELACCRTGHSRYGLPPGGLNTISRGLSDCTNLRLIYSDPALNARREQYITRQNHPHFSIHIFSICHLSRKENKVSRPTTGVAVIS